MTMLKKCTKLRTINVQSCKRITEKLVNDAIEFLQKNRDRELPLILYVYNTSIQTYTLSESQPFKEAVKTSLIVLDESTVDVFEDIDLDADEDEDEDEDDYFNR
ncbi:unnamed protein product [Ceratitis capitata]|uniref:(Mediterranean fruit fly) hypothetical protein n=1 Tax=Ceratitis capitata TaxID=7213 RepID=A0A811VB71_CERCA|nr:unnamed protein product [Ceratitis capitata]